jgi:RNA polymerase-binding transcription factor DksA
MIRQDRTRRAAGAAAPRTRSRRGGPRWRALLEARWRDRLQEVTELSVAFHEAGTQAQARRPHRAAQQLMRRAVVARRALAEVDEALGRLAVGQYGTCESCSDFIPAASLVRMPEVRYCPSCA